MQVREWMGDTHTTLCKFSDFYGGDCADIVFWVLVLYYFGTLYWHFLPVISFDPVPSTLKMEAACASKMSESTHNITVHKSWKHEVWFMKFLKWKLYFNYMFPQNTTAIVMYVKKEQPVQSTDSSTQTVWSVLTCEPVLCLSVGPIVKSFALNMDSKTSKTYSVHSLVLTAVLMKIQVFWDIMSYLYSSLRLLNPEDEDTVIIWKVSSCFPVNMA